MCVIPRPTWNVNNPSPNRLDLGLYQFISLWLNRFIGLLVYTPPPLHSTPYTRSLLLPLPIAHRLNPNNRPTLSLMPPNIHVHTSGMAPYSCLRPTHSMI